MDNDHNKNNASHLLKKIHLIDAVDFCAQVWRDVKVQTVKGCFKKAFLLQSKEGRADPLADVPLHTPWKKMSGEDTYIGTRS